MKFKTLRTISNWLLYPTLILWFLENMYFGWNAKPVSEAEIFLDSIVRTGLFFWFVVFILRLNKAIDFLTDLEDEG